MKGGKLSKENWRLKMDVARTQMPTLVSLICRHFYGDGPATFSHYTNILAK